ncbi:ATP-binding protein, partial [Muricoccus pecuniae]|uniref:ATP-binding protein n=1 Tax=Muricoccus pecuniae TaxID=693023 RepID=UPI001FED22DE
LLDRLTHHCHILETGNDSFRFRSSSAEPRNRVSVATRPVFRRGWWMCWVGLEQGASGRHYGRH